MQPKKTAVIFFFLCIAFYSVAQQQTDVVYLNNGSIIKGTITEKNEASTAIKTTCGNLWVFENTDIEKTETVDEPLPGYLKSSGYYNYSSMGFLIGSSQDDSPAVVSFTMEHNYQVNPNFSVGGTTGIEFFNETIIPLGANAKGQLPLKGRGQLFSNTSFGYSLPVEDVSGDVYYNYKETLGGVFFQADVGVVIPSQSRLNFFVSLGYRYNELNYVREDWYYDEIDRKVTYNRFALKFGIAFH